MGSSPDRIERRPIIVTVIGDGAGRVHVRWPAGYEYRHFKPKNVEKIETILRAGQIDALMVHVHTVVSHVRQACSSAAKSVPTTRLIEWHKGLNSFAAELPSMIAPGAMKSEGSMKLVQVTKHVRVIEASKDPDRRPPWPDAQVEALKTSIDVVIDKHFASVIEAWTAFAEDIDAPCRSQAEIRKMIERLRSGNTHETESLGAELAIMKSKLESTTEALKVAESSLIAMREKLDQVRAIVQSASSV